MSPGSAPGPWPSRSLTSALPQVLLSHQFGRDLVRAFDELLQPYFRILDDLDSYFDPQLTPDDFVHWLASWIGLSAEDGVSSDGLRERFPDALTALLGAGTALGIEAAIRARLGIAAEVRDSGGVAWSPRPGGPMPGAAEASVTAVVMGGGIDRAQVERVVAACKPAHVRHRVVIDPG